MRPTNYVNFCFVFFFVGVLVSAWVGVFLIGVFFVGVLFVGVFFVGVLFFIGVFFAGVFFVGVLFSVSGSASVLLQNGRFSRDSCLDSVFR